VKRGVGYERFLDIHSCTGCLVFLANLAAPQAGRTHLRVWTGLPVGRQGTNEATEKMRMNVPDEKSTIPSLITWILLL
jgi:hypothetical protein